MLNRLASQLAGRTILLAASLTLACAPPPRSGPLPSRAADRSVVGPDELRATGASDLYDALLRARPELTYASYGQPQRINVISVVYIDGVRYGGVSQLLGINTAAVREVRFLRGSASPSLTGDGIVEVTLGGPIR